MEQALDSKWLNNTLTVADIIPTVTSLAKEEEIDLTLYAPEGVKQTHEEGLEHVAKLIHRVYQWSQEVNPYPMGGFLTAVVENDLDGAVGRADHTNVRALPVYVKYFYNYAPRRWRTQKTHRGKAHDQQSRSLP